MAPSSKTFSKLPAGDEKVLAIPCPVCKGDRFKKKYAVEGALFVRCRGCGLLLQNPQPVRSALQVRYDDEYFEYEIKNEEIFFNLMMLGLKDADFFGKIVPALPVPLKILDVGCATGRLLRYFKESGWAVAGAELCRESAEYGNRCYGVNISASTLEDAGFQDCDFSVVHASHLIEHVNDPAGFVSEVHRILMPGGVFVCVTPAHDGLQARIFGSAWRSLIPDHVTLFDKRTLLRLLENGGFRVESTCTWGGLAAGTVPDWIKKPADRMAKSLGFGDVVLMTARKPG